MKATATPAVNATSRLMAGLTGFQAIDQLDLGPIKVKLMRQDGENWSLEQVNMTEKWYKRFLFLNLMHPSATIVPTHAIDTFWHYHILDTRKYAEDCQMIFGTFFHHFPYFGMRGDEDVKNHAKATASTKNLFLSEFGESLSELGEVFSLGNEASLAHADCNGECVCTGDSNGINVSSFSAHSKCNGEPICTGDPNDEVRKDCVTRPAFIH